MSYVIKTSNKSLSSFPAADHHRADKVQAKLENRPAEQKQISRILISEPGGRSTPTTSASISMATKVDTRRYAQTPSVQRMEAAMSSAATSPPTSSETAIWLLAASKKTTKKLHHKKKKLVSKPTPSEQPIQEQLKSQQELATASVTPAKKRKVQQNISPSSGIPPVQGGILSGIAMNIFGTSAEKYHSQKTHKKSKKRKPSMERIPDKVDEQHWYRVGRQQFAPVPAKENLHKYLNLQEKSKEKKKKKIKRRAQTALQAASRVDLPLAPGEQYNTIQSASKIQSNLQNEGETLETAIRRNVQVALNNILQQQLQPPPFE